MLQGKSMQRKDQGSKAGLQRGMKLMQRRQTKLSPQWSCLTQDMELFLHSDNTPMVQLDSMLVNALLEVMTTVMHIGLYFCLTSTN